MKYWNRWRSSVLDDRTRIAAVAAVGATLATICSAGSMETSASAAMVAAPLVVGISTPGLNTGRGQRFRFEWAALGAFAGWAVGVARVDAWLRDAGAHRQGAGLAMCVAVTLFPAALLAVGYGIGGCVAALSLRRKDGQTDSRSAPRARVTCGDGA